jgi:putative transposase
MESFHASLKKDLIHRRSWPTKAEARTAVFEYIETFYNRRRRHSRLGMLPPVEYENRTGTSAHTLHGPGAATRRAHTDQKISTTTSTAAQAA